MSTVPQRQSRLAEVLSRELWAGLAIVVIWLAVLFTAVYGSDIISTGATSSSTVPSAIAVALFASLATWPVAKYGFGSRRKDD